MTAARRAAPSPHEMGRDLIRVYLQPGQLYASAQPSAVTTVLGSCVAVCLWDPIEAVGGMNHYLLPFFAGAGQGSPRFGNFAMTELVDRLVALGASKGRLQAKVFGGACVLEAFQARQGHLGEKNAAVAFKLLEELAIPVFLYEAAASRPDRVSLADVRRGAMKGLRDAIGRDAARKPDIDPNQTATDLAASGRDTLDCEMRMRSAMALCRRPRVR